MTFLYQQLFNSYNVSSENFVLDQLIFPKLIFFFILITYLVVIVLVLQGEILSWLKINAESFLTGSELHCCSFGYHLQ